MVVPGCGMNASSGCFNNGRGTSDEADVSLGAYILAALLAKKIDVNQLPQLFLAVGIRERGKGKIKKESGIHEASFFKASMSAMTSFLPEWARRTPCSLNRVKIRTAVSSETAIICAISCRVSWIPI